MINTDLNVCNSKDAHADTAASAHHQKEPFQNLWFDAGGPCCRLAHVSLQTVRGHLTAVRTVYTCSDRFPGMTSQAWAKFMQNQGNHVMPSHLPIAACTMLCICYQSHICPSLNAAAGANGKRLAYQSYPSPFKHSCIKAQPNNHICTAWKSRHSCTLAM